MRLVPLLAVLLCGCSGLIAFDVNSGGDSTINGSGLGALGGLGSFGNISFSQDQSFANNNTSKDHISECHVTMLSLSVTSPSGGTLDFLQSVEFDIKTDTLQPVEIAYATSIPKGATRLDLQLTNADIAQYAKSDSFTITTKATGTQPSQTTTIHADLKLHINASLL